MRVGFLALAITTIWAAAPAAAKETKQPQVSVETLRSIQTRDFNYPADRIVSVVLNVLADQGYVIDSVDRPGGLINANKVANSRQSMAGMNVRQNTDIVNVLVNGNNDNSSSVRINIVDRYQYTYLGKPYKDEKTQITMPEKYDVIFKGITDRILP